LEGVFAGPALFIVDSYTNATATTGQIIPVYNIILLEGRAVSGHDSRDSGLGLVELFGSGLRHGEIIAWEKTRKSKSVANQ